VNNNYKTSMGKYAGENYLQQFLYVIGMDKKN